MMTWTHNTPTEPGLYYFRNASAKPADGDAAWLVVVGEVQDKALGLYAEQISAHIHARLPDGMILSSPWILSGILISPHPQGRWQPVSALDGEWWGPLPMPMPQDIRRAP